MADDIPDLLPDGLQDRIAPVAEAASAITRAMLDTMAGHGYLRVAPPLVEFEASLASRMQGAQPRQMFRFVDPVSYRTLALRSDMTVQTGRLATSRLAGRARPLRLCYGGPVLRLVAGQLRPEREMTQIGAELIGNDSVAAAMEIVSVAIEALAASGVEGVTVDFTLPDLVDTLAQSAFPLNGDAVEAVRRELDAKDAGALATLGAKAYLPLLFATGPFDDAIAKLKAIDAGGALASRIAGLSQIAQGISGMADLTLDPTERHGFEYQSWFGFSLYACGFSGAIGRGGTYAIRRPDGSEEVATGFSLYPDPLVEAGLGHVASDTVYLPTGTDSAVGKRLRDKGRRTVAQLDKNDDPAALGCTHIWQNGTLKTL